MNFDARMAELSSRVQTIDAALGDLDAKYLELAGRWDINDQGLLKEASIIETRITNLKRQKALTLAAGAQLELKRQAEAEAAEQAERDAKRREAKQHADAICSLNVEVDRTFNNLTALLSQRTAALKALGNTGIVSDVLTNRMQSKGPVTAAACHAGLARHIDIVAVANTSLRPLADSNRALGIAEPEPQPNGPLQRRPLRSNGDATP